MKNSLNKQATKLSVYSKISWFVIHIMIHTYCTFIPIFEINSKREDE